MNIQELQSERDALQNRLRSMIQKELQQFKNRTFVSVEGVSVYFVYTQAIGELRSEYLVDKVEVYLDI